MGSDYKSPEKSGASASRQRKKSPAREAPSAKSRKNTLKKSQSSSKSASREEIKIKELKYVPVKKEASDEAINLKKILKAEREEMPEIRKRQLTTSFIPVHFPAGRIYRPGVLVSTIPVTPTDTMITEMRERQQRTMNRGKGKAPRKYTNVAKVLKTANSRTASKSNSNEAKSNGRKAKNDKSFASRSKKAGKR